MTTPHNLDELVDRVEAATGPDRELDYAIADAALGPVKAPYRRGHCESYTASLDAAMTLFDDRNWSYWEVRSRHGLSDYSAEVSRIQSGEEEAYIGHAKTPALALTAACLRARASLTMGEAEG